MIGPQRTSRRNYKQLRRATLFGAQNGLCFWCEEPMILMSPYPKDGVLPRAACTIDHLRTRDNPRRQEFQPGNDLRLVAACSGCNQDRDSARHRSGQHLRELRA